MKLSELVQRSDVKPVSYVGDVEVLSMTMDSRKVTPGALFVCMPEMGSNSEGFLGDASARGAVAAVVFSPEGILRAADLGLAAVQLAPTRLLFSDEIWRICDVFYEHPTRNMKVVGITGTNGKTTTAWLVRDALECLGLTSAYLGTLGAQFDGEDRTLANTTPLAVELYGILAEMRDRGVEVLAIEVSSHALAEHRVDGVEFDVAVFTNLTQDHLDYHGTMEEYFAAKRRFFTDHPRRSSKAMVAAINVGDPAGKQLAESLTIPVLRYAVDAESELTGHPVSVDVSHIRLRIRAGERDAEFVAPLGGSYNVENLVSTVAAVNALGFSVPQIADCAKHLRPVPGRFESVPNDAGIGILVDYAHTPDAMEKLLTAVRPLTKGRVITVFGCGGDRDRLKRPLMAAAASRDSDLVIVTSDNPRTEDPQRILADVVAGIPEGTLFHTVIDRPQAVALAIRSAAPGDVVVIAGKGHENYQILGGERYPMDDRDLARSALKEKG